jgi:hypothetical protein
LLHIVELERQETSDAAAVEELAELDATMWALVVLELPETARLGGKKKKLPKQKRFEAHCVAAVGGVVGHRHHHDPLLLVVLLFQDQAQHLYLFQDQVHHVLVRILLPHHRHLPLALALAQQQDAAAAVQASQLA